jgi:drug/metabolite transporter (DMT)-like permease
MIAYITAFLCVLGLSVGQILFKLSAISLNEGKSLLAPRVYVFFIAAMCLYGVTSLAWVWILQKVQLARVYPVMSFAFILVPIGSHWIFDDNLNAQYLVGVIILITGIIVITLS